MPARATGYLPPPLPLVTVPDGLRHLHPHVVPDLIRLGGDGDGGYVLPERAVHVADGLVSLGLGADWSFDEEFLAMVPHARVHAYDHTVGIGVWRWQLVRAGVRLAAGRGTVREVTAVVALMRRYRRSFSVHMRHSRARVWNRKATRNDVTVREALGRIGSQQVVLKVDIEGAEYRIIQDIVDCADQIVGLIVEFHATERLRALFREATETLANTFDLVHLHANNAVGTAADGFPPIVELSFVRRGLCELQGRRSSLPVPGLDRANIPRKADFRLHFADQ
jgi:hypothetical protein